MELYWESVGAGEPVVLIHAGVADCRMWDAQVEALASRYRVIRYDAQGFGRSALSDAPRRRADDLQTVMDAAGVERAHLVGLSMGGATALDFALLYPSRGGALVLGASGVSGLDRSDQWLENQNRLEDEAVERGDFDEALRVDLQTWLAGPHRDLAEMPASLIDGLAPMALDVLHHDAERKPTPRLEPPAAGRLAEVAAPTLVMVGDVDVSEVIAAADVLAAGISGARKHVFQGAAHMLNLERPTEFNSAVLEFLSEHPL